MVEIRVFPFNEKNLRGEAESQGDVDNIDKFREWVMKYGQYFEHDQGAGSRGDVFIFAWKEKIGEWIPVADGIVMTSRRTDKKWVDVTLKEIRIYPNDDIRELRPRSGDHSIRLSADQYGQLITEAYR